MGEGKGAGKENNKKNFTCLNIYYLDMHRKSLCTPALQHSYHLQKALQDSADFSNKWQAWGAAQRALLFWQERHQHLLSTTVYLTPDQGYSLLSLV